MYNILSCGGVGDALIVSLKIQQFIKQQNLNSEAIEWMHFEKHECQYQPINDIVNYFFSGSCEIVEKPEQIANKMLNDFIGYLKFDTTITGLANPYLLHKIEIDSSIPTRKYICIQAQAGRKLDNTHRVVSNNLIEQVLKLFPNHLIVLLGPDDIGYHRERVADFTGTESVLGALSMINECDLFIGQDGVMAYYAAMIKKPTVISYHIPTLINHYWNTNWQSHVMPLTNHGNCLNQIPENKIFESIINWI